MFCSQKNDLRGIYLHVYLSRGQNIPWPQQLLGSLLIQERQPTLKFTAKIETNRLSS